MLIYSFHLDPSFGAANLATGRRVGEKHAIPSLETSS